MAGLFSVALVVAPRLIKNTMRPAVSWLAALWCSDFPLSRANLSTPEQRPPDALPIAQQWAV